MIEQFTKRWFSHNHIVRERFEKALPNSYLQIVEAVVTMLHDEDQYDSPDPERIVEIDHGDLLNQCCFLNARKRLQSLMTSRHNGQTTLSRLCLQYSSKQLLWNI